MSNPFRVTPIQTADFDEFVWQVSRRNGTIIALLVMAAMVLWWPADLVVYAFSDETRRVLVFMRLGFILGIPILWFLPEFFGRAPTMKYLEFVCLMGIAYCSCFLGFLGGPETPWLYCTYIAPIFGMAVLLNLRQRVLFNFACFFSCIIPYFGFHPHYLQSDWVPHYIGYMVFCCVAGTLFGHLVFALSYITFTQRQALAEKEVRLQERNAELRDLNTGLGEQVEARTKALRKALVDLDVTREKERWAFARELHDETGQQMALLAARLSVLRKQVHHKSLPSESEVREIQQQLDELRETLRRTARETRPLLAAHGGLVQAVQSLISQFEAATGLHVEWVVSPAELPLDEPIALVVYRFIQEGLTNIQKHAKARNVEVSVLLEDGTVRASVADDGIGLPKFPMNGEGIGLGSIRERAEAFGGCLSLHGGPSEGTEIAIELPMIWEQESS